MIVGVDSARERRFSAAAHANGGHVIVGQRGDIVHSSASLLPRIAVNRVAESSSISIRISISSSSRSSVGTARNGRTVKNTLVATTNARCSSSSGGGRRRGH